MGSKTEIYVPEYISEGTRVEIEQAGQALDAFTGKIITREGLEAYQAKQASKK